MSKNLVFIGATISGNKGSEMMLSTSIGEFRKIYPKGQFYIFSYYPKDDLKLIFDTSNIKIVNATPFLILMLHSTRGFLNYLVRKLKLEWLFPKISWFKNHNVSAIIDISGESFNDYNIFYLPYKILCVWLGVLNDVPVYKLPQSMGPFKKGINNYFATMCLKRCQRIYARGQITANHLSMLAIPKHKIQMATDLGFAYQSKYCLLLKKSTEVKEIVEDLVNIKNSSSNKIVAILPSVVKLSMDGNSYLGQMYSLLDYIVKLDYQIVILPNAFRDNVSSLHNNDYSLIEHLHQYVKSVSKRSPTSVLFSCSTEDIRSIVGISDHIITSRFHGMINALSLGKAPLVLSWSHKYFEILDSFELDWLDIDNYVEKEELVAKFEKLVSQQEYYDHQVALFQSKMKLEASQIFHDISAQLSDQE